jgi:uncharacterized protein with HEPN domain
MNKDEVLVRHMLDAIAEIEGFLQRMTYAEFLNDHRTMYATVCLLGILGEAAGNLSEEFRNAHADIPFGKIIGMRNHLIHRYFEVDLETVWKVCQDDMLSLQENLRKTLPS